MTSPSSPSPSSPSTTPSIASHLLPYVLYVAPPAAADIAPEAVRAWLGPAGVVFAAAALVVFARRGAYAELGPTLRTATSFTAGRATALAIGMGLAAAALWMPLAEIVPRLGSRGGFDPGAAGDAARPALWAARLLGFVVVIPFAEELLVRSLLPRWADAQDDWAARPVGAMSRTAMAVSLVFFAGTHPEWLAALVVGGLWTALVVRTGRLRDAVTAHIVANGALAVVWAACGDTSWW
ncbi:MAG: CAAX prenyl protease-related protein [Planctomycetes bacterium]|nr:CAAX prenyl protease-related protein [Planctomycetota bacterium]